MNTGGFWVDMSTYTNLSAVSKLTPHLCSEFFICVVDGGNCTEFERTSKLIVDEYILEEHFNTTMNVFPDLGDPTAPGSVSMRAKIALHGQAENAGNGSVGGLSLNPAVCTPVDSRCYVVLLKLSDDPCWQHIGSDFALDISLRLALSSLLFVC